MYTVNILGKEFKTESKRTYNTLLNGLEVITWMQANGNDYKKACAKFQIAEKGLRIKLTKLGYVVDSKKKSMTRKFIEQAIMVHLETGSIITFCKKAGVLPNRVGARMRLLGYSSATRSYSLRVRGSNMPTRRPIESFYNRILYNKLLSYDEDFILHRAFYLTG